MKKLILIAIVAFMGMHVYPQDPEIKSDTLRKDALNVFMEAGD